MKTNLRVFTRILVVLLFSHSIGCDTDDLIEPLRDDSHSYDLVSANGLGPKDGVSGIMTLRNRGSWSILIFLDASTTIGFSGQRSTSYTLYVDSYRLDGISVPIEDSISYTSDAFGNTIRFTYKDMKYVWRKED